MAELDPSIILRAGNINDPQQMLTLKSMAQQIDQRTQAAQSQNALKKLLSQPGAIDPNTGSLSPGVIGQVTQVDPEKGMEFAQQRSLIEKRESDEKKARIKELADMQHQASEASVQAVKDASERGPLPDSAKDEIVQKSWADYWDNVRKQNLVAPDEMPHVPNPTYAQVRGWALTDPVWRKEERQETLDVQHEQHQDFRDDLASKREAAMLAALAARNGPIASDDPRVDMMVNGELTYAQATRRMNPNQAAELLKQVKARDPSYDPVKSVQRTEVAQDIYSSKPNTTGATIQAGGRFAEHLTLLPAVVNAMNKHHFQTVNRLWAAIGAETGDAAPTNMQQLASALGNELEKFSAGGPGTGEERKEKKSAFENKLAAGQIEGAVDIAHGLLYGAMVPIIKRYQSVKLGDEDKFVNEMLTPAMAEAYRAEKGKTREKFGDTTAPPSATTPPDASKLKAGKVMMIDDKQGWTLVNGKPQLVRVK